jgi:hypothetical protein
MSTRYQFGGGQQYAHADNVSDGCSVSMSLGPASAQGLTDLTELGENVRLRKNVSSEQTTRRLHRERKIASIYGRCASNGSFIKPNGWNGLQKNRPAESKEKPDLSFSVFPGVVSLDGLCEPELERFAR